MIEVSSDSLQFFEMVHIADLVHQMVDVYYNEDVKPWIDEHDFLSELIVEKKSFERLLDDSVALGMKWCDGIGMDKSLQLLVLELDYILANDQKPNDFNPLPGSDNMDIEPTKACEKAIQCLNAHIKVLSGATEKNTLEVFFQELGIRFFK